MNLKKRLNREIESIKKELREYSKTEKNNIHNFKKITEWD